MTTVVVPAILVAAGAVMSWGSGVVLYRLAPAAGYLSETERQDFRSFGQEWGWLTPLPVLLVWFAAVWTFHAPPRRSSVSATVGVAGYDSPAMGRSVVAARASRGRRLAAVCVDGLLLSIVSTLWLWIAVGVVSLLGGGGAAAVAVVMVLGWVGIIWLFVPWCLARAGVRNGQTPGKQLLGVRVVRLDGQPLELGRSLLREVVGRNLLSVLTFGLYGMVDSAWCLFDAEQQTLHDKAARTVVVEAR